MTGSHKEEIQRAVMACGDDGIWDMALGVILLFTGLVEWLSWHAAWASAVVLVVPLAIAAKRLMTANRLLDHEVRRSPPVSIIVAIGILTVAIVIVLLLLGGLIAFTLLSGLPEWIGALLPFVVPVSLALLGVIIMVTVGAIVGAPGRYFLYAAVLAASFLALLWSATPSWVAFVVPGGFMVCVGLGCLGQFAASHPQLPEERRLRFRF